MIKFRYIAACIAMVFALVSTAQAQREALVGVSVQQRRVALPKNQTAAILDTLNLPFFDDFSAQTNGVPNPRKWLDRYVYVNRTYGINQPTMGVATFDISDELGHIYAHANSSGFAADTLTSMPIRLQPSDANVYFSFYYQPQGNGDVPERRDSLTLQFFAPADSTWVSVWSATTDVASEKDTAKVLSEIFHLSGGSIKQVYSDSLSRCFFKVMLPVSEARFLHAGFQLRFINRATRLRSEVQGREGNCDIWNVDMVYLNSNRSAADTVVVDVAIQTPVQRLLKEYTVMPWSHLKNSLTAQREQLVSGQGSRVTISSKIVNLSNRPNTFNIYFELSSPGSTLTYPNPRVILSPTYEPLITRSYPFNLSANNILDMAPPDEDSVVVDVRTVLFNYELNEQLRSEFLANDTSTFRQHFYPYYAYDDGSAENGYGVFGDKAHLAKVAVKFKAYRRDTLSGVYLYFNSTLDSGNLQPFRLTVWSDRNGAPDVELYSEANCLPRFDSLNSYVRYPLSRPIILDEGATFYVGWAQQSAAFLNVGFDVNNNVVGKQFVFDEGKWQQSEMDGLGMLMVRPSFAKQKFDLSTAVRSTLDNARRILVYPNPVHDELYFELPDALRQKTLRVEVFDFSGKRLTLCELSSASSVNVSALPQGVYVVRFSESGRVVGYAKFVKM